MKSYRNSEPAPPIMVGSPPELIVPWPDWDRPPWNRWAFQHVREFLPTAEVWRGDGPVRPLPEALEDLDRLPVISPSGRRVELEDALDLTYTDGFLVLKSGRLVYERYYNGMNRRTPHLSQSVAKSVTGAVAGILVDAGVLDPARPVTDYLPELRTTGWRGATLQHVLDMTTGVRFSEEYTDPFSDIGQVDVASGWKPIPPDADPSFRWPGHMWELIQGLDGQDRAHGVKFSYRSIETDVLAFVMEHVTGRRLPQLVSEELWQRIGAEESAFFTVDPAGYALADGGFNATLRDYARFGLAVLEGEIVPRGWIEATRIANRADQSEARSESRADAAYRNQFWIEDSTNRDLMCLGVFGQMIHIGFAADMVVVKLSTWPDFLDTGFSLMTLDAVRAIRQALS